MLQKIYSINGKNFNTLEEFYQEISQSLIPDMPWGKNLDAFNDILNGGFGLPEDSWVLIWRDSATSRERLGYPETIRQLEQRLEQCHITYRPRVQTELEQARQHQGSTVFDWLVKIIKSHSEIDLVLE